jgi:hypothetical protein
MHPDAGRMIDTSCGIDCEAQRKYGLIARTCFEYSDNPTTAASPPVLAAEVMQELELEGGIKVMQVKYTSGGQRRMQDSFAIANGELKLVRREFGAGGTSVSFKNDTMALEGVKWLELASGAGVSYTTASNADVVTPGARVSESTTYRATLSAATSSDLQLPLPGGVDGGVKLLFSETPIDHGSDSRRIWTPGLGFVLITTPLALTMGTSQEYLLQNVKDTTDGGLCGF